ncbi:NUDIX hydrolase [Virgibacillus necropolis]|uniref:DNA mismatch repair protein MutT n=1 Tax=Virgibacillus necropolis TaxID=163877 RepID=A0A221MH88_9BACI|nr:NUDIX hydrolase [Virgibacillus necropolis]ASN06959.1 DNA mismatch repair protein MutT [Virgibacillus necropolis]
MTHDKNFYRTMGVYGIYQKNNRLLVIDKNGGPYINRYDLPGGRLEDGESLTNAMKREFLEETGLGIEITKNIGTIDFMLPWDCKDYTHVHHIAIFYSVKKTGGELTKPEQFEGQDSDGAHWVSEDEISVGNASPLVMKAFEWVKSKELGLDRVNYKDWEIK